MANLYHVTTDFWVGTGHRLNWKKDLRIPKGAKVHCDDDHYEELYTILCYEEYRVRVPRLTISKFIEASVLSTDPEARPKSLATEPEAAPRFLTKGAKILTDTPWHRELEERLEAQEKRKKRGTEEDIVFDLGEIELAEVPDADDVSLEGVDQDEVLRIHCLGAVPDNYDNYLRDLSPKVIKKVLRVLRCPEDLTAQLTSEESLSSGKTRRVIYNLTAHLDKHWTRVRWDEDLNKLR